MKSTLKISSQIFSALRAHLFQGEKQQAAFLLAREFSTEDAWGLCVEDIYLVPGDAWEVQNDLYLQMSSAAQKHIIDLALASHFCLIDCHSHPHSGDEVWFSSSDVSGIIQFVHYIHWKLNKRPFVATVWGEKAVDAVVWKNDFKKGERLDSIQITDSQLEFIPKNSWFRSEQSNSGFAADPY